MVLHQQNSKVAIAASCRQSHHAVRMTTALSRLLVRGAEEMWAKSSLHLHGNMYKTCNSKFHPHRTIGCQLTRKHHVLLGMAPYDVGRKRRQLREGIHNARHAGWLVLLGGGARCGRRPAVAALRHFE